MDADTLAIDDILAMLFELFDLNATGTLFVATDEGKTLHVVIQDGFLMGCSYKDQYGLDALNAFMAVDSGRSSFLADRLLPVLPRARVERTTEVADFLHTMREAMLFTQAHTDTHTENTSALTKPMDEVSILKAVEDLEAGMPDDEALFASSENPVENDYADAAETGVDYETGAGTLKQEAGKKKSGSWWRSIWGTPDEKAQPVPDEAQKGKAQQRVYRGEVMPENSEAAESEAGHPKYEDSQAAKKRQQRVYRGEVIDGEIVDAKPDGAEDNDAQSKKRRQRIYRGQIISDD